MHFLRSLLKKKKVTTSADVLIYSSFCLVSVLQELQNLNSCAVGCFLNLKRFTVLEYDKDIFAIVRFHDL